MNLYKKVKYIFLVILILSSVSFMAQTNVKLSYESFLDNVLANNPLSRKAENAKKYGSLQYQAARGNYDPMLNGSFENKNFNNTNYYTILNGELKQPIFTSQFLKMGYEYGIGANINPEQSTSDFGLPFLGLEVGLLQGLVIDSRRANVLKSKEYVDYYDAERNIQLNALLFQSSQKYFDWLYSCNVIRLNEYFMNLANQRLKGVESLSEIGERAAIDTVEAAIYYQTRFLDFQSALIDNQKQINELNVFNVSVNFNGNTNYEPADSLPVYFEKMKNTMIQRLYYDTVVNPVIEQYRSYQNVLEIEKRLKKEMIKPRLNVNYNLLSNNKTSANPIFSNNNYKWGANVSFPLFLRNSRNEYKMSKINAENNNLELTNANNELNFKINALKQTLKLIGEQLLYADKAAKYSKLLVEAEKLKFNNGESSLFMLNTREAKWLESELKLVEYKLKFVKTILSLIYLNGNQNYKL
jgi:outer membrane protein TolC